MWKCRSPISTGSCSVTGNDFCVWEVRCGMQVYPPQEKLDEMREGLVENPGPMQL